MNPAEELHLRHQLDSCLSIYIALKDYLREHNFTHVFAYGQYGINLAACLAAEHSSLRWNLLQHLPHNGVDRQRLFVQQQATTRSRYRNINSEWWDYRDNTFTATDLAESVGDVLARMSSRNPLVYSPTKSASSDVLNELNISVNQKVIVAFTSNLDEQSLKTNDLVIPPSVPRHKPQSNTIRRNLNGWRNSKISQLSIPIGLSSSAFTRGRIQTHVKRRAPNIWKVLRSSFQIIPKTCESCGPRYYLELRPSRSRR